MDVLEEAKIALAQGFTAQGIKLFDSVEYAEDEYIPYKAVAEKFKKAIELDPNNKQAQYYLANCYYDENSDVYDEEEALRIYVKLAEEGYAEAQYELAFYYAYLKCGNYWKEAIKWCEKACEQGFAEAQLLLGEWYDHGEGVEKDDLKALDWFIKAAEQGNARAQYYVGTYYQRGKILGQDDKRAAYFFERAAKQGDAWAQCALGVCYEKGLGVAQDIKEAIKWYKESYMVAASTESLKNLATQGNIYAIRVFQELAEAGDEESRELIETFKEEGLIG